MFGLAVIRDYEGNFPPEETAARQGDYSFYFTSEFAEWKEAADYLLIDADYDYLSLVGVAGQVLSIYRQKPLWPEAALLDSQILNEVENTIQFIESKNKRKPQ